MQLIKNNCPQNENITHYQVTYSDPPAPILLKSKFTQVSDANIQCLVDLFHLLFLIWMDFSFNVKTRYRQFVPLPPPPKKTSIITSHTLLNIVSLTLQSSAHM